MGNSIFNRFYCLGFLGCTCVTKLVITGSKEYLSFFICISHFFFFFFLQFKKFLLENNAGFNLSIVHVFFFFCEVKLFAKKVKIKSTQRDMKSNNATIKITSQITIFFLKQQKSPLGLHDFTVSQITCTCKRNCSY